MFEILLQLPLFQGSTIEQLTQLISSTGMDFQKYAEGDVILSRGEDCGYIRLLISGSVRLSSPYYEETLTVHETLSAPHIILPNFMYGWQTVSPATVVAAEESGILQFSKPVFEKILSTYPIFLINYLNIISLRSQMNYLSTQKKVMTLEERLFDWIELLTQRGSTNVVIETPRANLADAMGVPRLAIYSLLEELHRNSKIKLTRGRFDIL